MTKRTRQMVAVAAAIGDATFNEIMSGCRRRPLPLLRYLVAQELLKSGYSLSKAGAELNIDHVTVMHGMNTLEMIHSCKTYKAELDVERDFLRWIQEIDS